ncbi:hypothetical protein KUTeg_000852, partial [Tegillarca granosa]
TYDFWIDGTDEAVEGTWKYGSTGSIFVFTDWYPGQPNNYYNQDCAGLYRSFNFRWDDFSCIGHRYYICEKSAVVSLNEIFVKIGKWKSYKMMRQNILMTFCSTRDGKRERSL